MELKIEYLKKEELKPYANNAKVHTADQIEQIKNSIKEFGFNDPIGIWGENEVVEGHGRLLAVMEMDIDEIPVIRLDNMTDEQRKAYAIVHNKLTMNTDFDMDILNMELDDIIDIDMSEFGFENDVISYDQIDGGGLEDKTDSKVAVKVIFQNAKDWRKQEKAVRDFIDGIENVSVSVGEYNEN